MLSRTRIRFQSRSLVALSMAAILAVTGVELAFQPEAAVAADSKKSEVEGPLERVDPQAASLLARTKNKRVEVTGARTERTTTWANADGSFTDTEALAPVRVEQADGTWEKVDLALATAPDGTVAPRVAARPFALSAAQSTDAWNTVVSAGEGKQKLEWLWDGKLPTPKVEGYTATYPDVAPDVDLVVSSQTTGFEISFILKKRPEGAVALPLAVRSGAGLDLKEKAGGVFEAVDAKGKVIARSQQPAMWDAESGADTGSPRDARPVEADLVAVGSTAANVELPAKADDVTEVPTSKESLAEVLDDAPAGSRPFIMAPDAAYLADPTTTYPVTVDPSVTFTTNFGTSFDTSIENGITHDQSGANYLNMGTSPTRGAARAIMRFYLGGLAGKKIIDADLKLWQLNSATCTPNIWDVWRSDPASTSSRWTSPPALLAAVANSNITKGFSAACPNGDSDVDVTTEIQNVANLGTNAYWLQLKSRSEGTNTTRHDFVSSENPANKGPVMSVTYTNKPDKPTGGAGVLPGAWDTTNRVYNVGSTTPTLTGRPVDRDGGDVRSIFWLEQKVSGVWTTLNLYSKIGTTVTSGQKSTYTVDGSSGFTLVNGGEYRMTHAANDNYVSGLPSGYTYFNVDTTAPNSPSASCTGLTSGSWVNSLSSTSCTLTATDAGGSTKSGVSTQRWGLDTADTVYSAAAPSGSAVVPIGGLEDGWHTLVLQSVDRAGNRSTPTTVGFGVGHGVVEGLDRETIGSEAPLKVKSRPGYTSATVQYSTDGVAWTTIPSGDLGGSNPLALSVPSGAPSAESASITWDVPNSILNGTVVQVRACFPSAPTCTAIESVTVDRSGEEGPTTDVGPVSVSLLAGGLATTAKDVSIAGPLAEFTVQRSFSTLNPTTDSVFGPGWSASLPDARATGAEQYDTATPAKLIRVLGTMPDETVDPSTVCGYTNATSTGVPTGTWQPGCRGLRYFYDGSAHITRIAYDYTGTSAAAPSSVDVACYSYGAGGRLTSAWDPRGNGTGGVPSCADSPARATTYDYDGSGRLEELTPAGQAPWSVSYDGDDRVDEISRTHGGGGSESTVIDYDFNVGPASGSGDESHPDLSAAATATWGQTKGATKGTAVYEPSADPADPKTAKVYGFSADNALVGTAVFSGQDQAGWKVESSQSNAAGTETRHLSAANRDLALNPGSEELTLLGLNGATGPEIAEKLSETTITSTDGATTETLGPVHLVRLKDGGQVAGRAHTVTYNGTVDYPAADPTNWVTEGPKGSPIRAVTTVQLADYTEVEPTEVRTAYSLKATSPTADERRGWDLGLAMQSITEMGATDIVTQTRYDETGNVVERRQPRAKDQSADPASRESEYFTAGSHSVSACTSDAWVGLLCREGPKAQPSTGYNLATTTYSTYDAYLRSTVVTKTAPSVTDEVETKTYSSGGLGLDLLSEARTGGLGTSLGTKTSAYDGGTGLVISETLGGYMQSRTYDDFGRVIVFKDAYSSGDATSGATIESTYDPDSGELLEVTHKRPNGTVLATQEYTYGATTPSADERRPVVIAVDHSDFGVVGTVYDADGTVASEAMPGDITMRTSRDPLGRQTEVTYGKPGNQWFTDSMEFDIQGRVVATSGDLQPASREYQYDDAGRMTTAEETRLASGTTCQTRVYGYSGTAGLDSLRTSLSTYPAATDGTCSTSTTPTVVSSTYDTADRPTSGMTLDRLGRASAIAAGSTAATSSTALTYYSNGTMASTVSDGQRFDYDLDPASRVRKIASGPTGGPVAQTTVNHYGDAANDIPSWYTDTVSAGTTTVRPVLGADGTAIGLTRDAGSGATAQINLVSTAGEIVRTTSPGATGAPDGALLDSDEFGNQRDSALATTAPIVSTERYGWRGATLRSTQTGNGTVLMGSRVYVPRLGAFTSEDPVYTGNENPYGYAVDPVNSADDAGQAACPKQTKNRKFSQYYEGKCWAVWTKHHFWQDFPKGKDEIGIYNDGCSVPKKLRWVVGNKDKPYRFNFLPACNVHDFGFALMRGTSRGTFMPWSQAPGVDWHFGNNLKVKVCQYDNTFRGRLAGRYQLCNTTATVYHLAVVAHHKLKGYKS